MPSDKDVLGQADALLRRHSISAPGSGADTGAVPLLTDLVEHLDTGSPTSVDPPTSELAREVFERVMAEVEGRLAAELERRLAQHLIPQVHAAVASAIGDLHQELANTIGDAVKEALERRSLK